MTVERAWPLLLPAVLVAALFMSASWLGLFRLLPDNARIAIVVLFLLALFAAAYPLRYFRRPTTAEIDRRIEHANDLRHTPVLAQSDALSGGGSPFAQALWREHQRRMARQLQHVHGDAPRTGVPERDPWGMRAAVALLLVTAFAFSFGPLGGRVTDGFRAHAGAEAAPPRVDAWITPPAYTRKAPIFLTAGSAAERSAVTVVPEGSDVTVRVTGGAGNETLIIVNRDGEAREMMPAGAGAEVAVSGSPAPAASVARQFSGKLEADGELLLKSGETDLQRWAFSVTDDTVPVVRFTDEPKRAVNGTLELNYEVVDDYGEASAKAELALDEHVKPGERPL
ncbi:MAG: DUF4175 family protein, partial [Rhizobiaceae bacterium]|nr:DUF4175 family protein [Rhizobiaceae bacterium]